MYKIIVGAALCAASVGIANAEPFSSPILAQGSAHVSNPFGQTQSGVFHVGVDIAAAAGSEVRAPAGGEIRAVHAPGELAGYHGQVVEIDHGAEGRTRFSNLESVTAAVGDRIAAGAIIGRIGANETPHVHVELWRGEAAHDPAQAMVLIAAR